MKSLIQKGLLTLAIIIGLQISTMAEGPVATPEAGVSGAAVVGYFLLLVAFIVAPAFKKSQHTAH
jgi:hypothetical protein